MIRRRRRRSLLALSLLLGMEIVAALLTSPVFAVRNVSLSGVSELTRSETEALLKAVALPPGTNLVRAPVVQMNRRLAAFPWVRTAHISRRPLGGLRIEIEPRAPTIIAQTGAGNFEMDADRIPIRIARPETWNRLPLVALSGPHTVQTGVVLPDSGLAAALQVYRSQSADASPRIAKIEVDPGDNLCLNMHSGIRVQFGNSDEIEPKLALMRRIFALEPAIAERVSSINLSCPDCPACLPRTAVPAGALGGASSSYEAGSLSAGFTRTVGSFQPGATRPSPAQMHQK